MRTILRSILFFAASIAVFTVSAQDAVGINEIQLNIPPKGEKPAFEFYIPDLNADAVLTAWNRFHRPFGATPAPFGRDANYFISDNASIELLSENTIDIYTRIYETGNGVRFACAFDLGGVFISSGKMPDKYQTARTILNRFYAGMALDAIMVELKAEERQLSITEARLDSVAQTLAGLTTEELGQRAVIDSAAARTDLLKSRKFFLLERLEYYRTETDSLRELSPSDSPDISEISEQIQAVNDKVREVNRQIRDIDDHIAAYDEAIETARIRLGDIRESMEPVEAAESALQEAIAGQKATIAELQELQSSIR